MDAFGRLEVLARSARCDVSCASSGSHRTAAAAGRGRTFGSAVPMGICHSFADDGRCVSLLKVLLSNACVNDCAYCVNRRSSNVPRAGFRVGELVALTEAFYRRNSIEGLFLSSGVVGSPDLTVEMLIRVARTLRLRSGFAGYIHLKIIPGCSPILVREAGFWADRLSVNIELPSERSLRLLAPEKTGSDILGIMRTVRGTIEQNRTSRLPAVRPPAQRRWAEQPSLAGDAWAPAGQSTQLVVGASPESDRHILALSENLYGRCRLRQVYYSAFAPVGPDPRLPAAASPPLRREHRLYEADWLLRFYGFTAAEVLDEALVVHDVNRGVAFWSSRGTCGIADLAGLPAEIRSRLSADCEPGAEELWRKLMPVRYRQFLVEHPKKRGDVRGAADSLKKRVRLPPSGGSCSSRSPGVMKLVHRGQYTSAPIPVQQESRKRGRSR